VRAKFEKGPAGFITCPHQIETWVSAMHYEQQLAALRERMEDLCEEMERVQKGEGRKFIFGPGADEDAAF
jgi:hypothetical protein